MAKILNHFGQDPNSAASSKKPLPYIVDNASVETTYICFFETGDAPRVIHRFQNNKLTIAYGKWDERADLDYKFVPNELITVNQ